MIDIEGLELGIGDWGLGAWIGVRLNRDLVENF